MLVLSSRRSGGSSLGFRAGSIQARKHANDSKTLRTLVRKRQNITINLL